MRVRVLPSSSPERTVGKDKTLGAADGKTAFKNNPCSMCETMGALPDIGTRERSLSASSVRPLAGAARAFLILGMVGMSVSNA